MKGVMVRCQGPLRTRSLRLLSLYVGDRKVKVQKDSELTKVTEIFSSKVKLWKWAFSLEEWIPSRIPALLRFWKQAKYYKWSLHYSPWEACHHWRPLIFYGSPWPVFWFFFKTLEASYVQVWKQCTREFTQTWKKTNVDWLNEFKRPSPIKPFDPALTQQKNYLYFNQVTSESQKSHSAYMKHPNFLKLHFFIYINKLCASKEALTKHKVIVQALKSTTGVLKIPLRDDGTLRVKLANTEGDIGIGGLNILLQEEM